MASYSSGVPHGLVVLVPASRAGGLPLELSPRVIAEIAIQAVGIAEAMEAQHAAVTGRAATALSVQLGFERDPAIIFEQVSRLSASERGRVGNLSRRLQALPPEQGLHLKLTLINLLGEEDAGKRGETLTQLKTSIRDAERDAVAAEKRARAEAQRGKPKGEEARMIHRLQGITRQLGQAGISDLGPVEQAFAAARQDGSAFKALATVYEGALALLKVASGRGAGQAEQGIRGLLASATLTDPAQLAGFRKDLNRPVEAPPKSPPPTTVRVLDRGQVIQGLLGRAGAMTLGAERYALEQQAQALAGISDGHDFRKAAFAIGKTLAERYSV